MANRKTRPEAAAEIPPVSGMVEIPVAPEDRARFLEGVEYYGMTAKPKARNSDYFIVTFSNCIDLYWLAANLYGPMPYESSLTKRSF